MTMAGLGPPLFKTQMTKLCREQCCQRDCGKLVRVKSHLRTCDAECEEVARAHPIDRTLGDLEILRGGGRDRRECKPLSHD